MAKENGAVGDGAVTDADVKQDTELALLDPVCARSDEIKGLIEKRRKLFDQMRELTSKEDFTSDDQQKFNRLEEEERTSKNRQDALGRILQTEAARKEELESLKEIRERQASEYDDLLPDFRQSAAQRDEVVDEARCFRAWALGQNARPDDVEYARSCNFPLSSTISLVFHRGLSETGEVLSSTVDPIVNGMPRINKRTAIHHVKSRTANYSHLIGGAAESPAALDTHYRQQGTTPDTAGGFTVPNEMMRAIDVALLDFGGVRQASEVISTMTGALLPWPTVNDTSQKGERVDEQAQVAQQDIVFGQMQLNAYKYSSKEVLISLELLQDSATNMPALIGRLLGERIGRIHADDFTVGTGTGQPNGIVTASTLGHTTAAGVLTTFDWPDLMTLEHSVDPAYRRQAGAGFMMNDAALLVTKQIKDTQNRPLWQTSLVTGAPGTFDGYPIFINQSMAAPAASAKSVLFGALQKFKIRDVMPMTLFRQDELYIRNGQIGYLMFSRNDSDLLDAGTNPVKHMAHPAA